MRLKQMKSDVFRAIFPYFPKDIGDIYNYAGIISNLSFEFEKTREKTWNSMLKQ